MKRHYYFKGVFIVLIAMLILSTACVYGAEESITVTTYYPSPYGVYSEMRLYPKASATLPCQEGTLYYDNDPIGEQGLRICSGIPADWVPIGGSFWTLTGTGLHPNNTTWNVGIGTTNPQRSLHVVATGTVVPPLAPRHRVVIQDNGAPLNAVSLALLGGSAGGSGVDFGDTDAIDAGRILYRHDTNSMQFFTSATERVRIDNAGNVGIGTTPGSVAIPGCPGCSVRLDVRGNILALRGNSLGGVSPTGILIDEDSPAGAGLPAQAGYSLSRLGVQQWAVGMNSDNSFFIWNPFDGEAIHISPPGTGGNVGIRNGNPNSLAPNGLPGNLDVNDIFLRSTSRWASSRSDILQSVGGQYTLAMQGDGNLVIYGPLGVTFSSGTWGGQIGPNYLKSGNGQYFLAMQNDGNLVMYLGGVPVWWSKNTLSCAGSCWSDASLKDNIAALDGSLAKIQQLRGVSFRWKDKQRGEGPQIGLIAQEVEKVFPEVVGSMSGLKSVEYGRLVAPLIEALKEQQAQIEAQGRLIKQLQDEFNAVKAKSASQ